MYWKDIQKVGYSGLVDQYIESMSERGHEERTLKFLHWQWCSNKWEDYGDFAKDEKCEDIGNNDKFDLE